MAFKVLCVVLFICVIDSLHSASVQRMKRGDTEEPTTAASTDNKGSEATTTKPGGLPGLSSLNVPQFNQLTAINNIVSQNQTNSIMPDNIKNMVPSGVPSGLPSVLTSGLPSGVPSGLPSGLPCGGEHEATKEPEKSDGGDHPSSPSNGGVAENLQITKFTDNFQKVISNKELTKLDYSKIPIVGGKE